MEEKPIRGRMLRIAAPEWEPLAILAPDHVDDFMWMYSVELRDGTRLQAYKHCWTRGYLHLSQEGRAFVFVPKTRYREVDSSWLLARVLDEEWRSGSFSYSVRQNVWPEEAKISWNRSATKHRISRQRSRHVIEHCGLQFIDWRWNPAHGEADIRVIFLGDDLEAVPIEVIAAEIDDDEFLVIHAMKLRDRFKALYEEARRWRR